MSYYKSFILCFDCNSRPATIKCLNCRSPKYSEKIQKFCYECDRRIHDSQPDHQKDLIPFNEMKSAIKSSLISPTKSNLSSSFLKKDLSISASIMNPSPSSLRSPASSSLLSPPSSFAPPSLLLPSNSSFHSDFERKVKESRKKEIIDRINNLTLKLSPKKEKAFENEPKIVVHASIFGTVQENLREEANRSFVETGKKAFIEAENINLENALKAEIEKNNKLSEHIEKISQDYDKQIKNSKSALQSLKEQYEVKLKDFQQALKSSTTTVKELQNELRQATSCVESEETVKLKSEVKEKNDAILELERQLNEKKKHYESSSQKYEKEMKELDDQIKELSANNKVKQEQMIKLHEMINNFEELFKRYKEEKEILILENKKINEELEKFRQYLNLDFENNEEEDQEEGQEEEEDPNHNQQPSLPN